MIRPVMFEWTAEGVMAPLPRFKRLCDRQYAVHEQYALAPVDNISDSSRRGFFGAIRETWRNLPEDDNRFPSEEHLRKRALVGAGWAAHSQYVLDTPTDAKKLAVILRRHDEYAVIRVSGNTLDVWVAKSIGGGQITPEEWKQVKPRALDWAAAQIHVRRTELEKHSKDGGAR